MWSPHLAKRRVDIKKLVKRVTINHDIEIIPQDKIVQQKKNLIDLNEEFFMEEGVDELDSMKQQIEGNNIRGAMEPDILTCKTEQHTPSSDTPQARICQQKNLIDMYEEFFRKEAIDELDSMKQQIEEDNIGGAMQPCILTHKTRQHTSSSDTPRDGICRRKNNIIDLYEEFFRKEEEAINELDYLKQQTEEDNTGGAMEPCILTHKTVQHTPSSDTPQLLDGSDNKSSELFGQLQVVSLASVHPDRKICKDGESLVQHSILGSDGLSGQRTGYIFGIKV
ncbi:hypothetical protein GUJ93_ZPchr0002g23631 [Zizania palustris]|uniref:Uncharacterized protein n=1 Tax=Zizania palustris TaxID=103762 RepID=A0A8J5RSN5_ZIZPA|nr:hypothetical protein GUJ93_ZPchr0002g23631 [Zizania palustris]